MEKDELMLKTKRVRTKMVGSVVLQVLGFGVMIVGAVGIAAEGAKDAWGLGLLLAVAFLVTGVIMLWVGIEIQPYKDFGWEEDKEGDLLRKELRARR